VDSSLQSDDSPSPIKDILYAQIQRIGEAEIRQAVNDDSAAIIKTIINDSNQKIKEASGSNDEKYCGFVEGLFHYLLTNALIPSQRKITVNGTDIDMVIPDARTLSSSPKNAIVIHFAKSPETSGRHLAAVGAIQPARENVWVVSYKGAVPGYKTYEIAGSQSIGDLFEDIKKFASTTPQSRFKIFKVGS